MHDIIKLASEAGAKFSAYTFIRLNGAIKLLFHDWLLKNFPDRADKVWHLIEGSHNGKVNDSRWGVRMRGEGNIAELVAMQYRKYTNKYGLNHERLELDCTRFMRPGEQGKLF
jgi:DNA repair photolyase